MLFANRTLKNSLVISYSAFVCCSVVVSEGASGATVSTGATSALPTILLDAKTLLTHKWYPKTYKKYEISCGFRAFCLSLQKIVYPGQNEV